MNLDPIGLIEQAAARQGYGRDWLVEHLFNDNKSSASKYLNRRVRLPASIALLANSLLGTDITEGERMSYCLIPYPSAGKQ